MDCRLQQEMQKYLSLRQAYQVHNSLKLSCLYEHMFQGAVRIQSCVMQDGDAPELQKRCFVCFRTMSRLLTDPAKAEENFRVLNQLKDANVWKILTNLLDPNTSFQQAYSFRVLILHTTKLLKKKRELCERIMTCKYFITWIVIGN